MAKTMTTADLAATLDTDPRTLRKFLRSPASPVESVGKGKRYSLPATQADLRKFSKAFSDWRTAQAERAAAREAELEAAEDATETVEEDAPEAEQEPTDAELEALEIDDEAPAEA